MRGDGPGRAPELDEIRLEPEMLDFRDVGLRIPLPPGVEAHTDSAHPPPPCLMLRYRRYQEPELIGALERALEAIRRGPVR